MQTNLNPFDKKHTRFKGYSLFLYIPSPSPTPLTVIDEMFWRGIKNGTPAGRRTEEKISIGEVKENQIYVY